MMIHSNSSFRFHRTVLALAVCALFVPVHAQTKVTETTISAGVGVIDGSRADRAQFGQYNGLRKHSAFATLDVDYTLRDEATARWVDFLGANLLGDTREMNLVVKRPGDWKFTADYNELVRYDPYTVNTGLLGAGSTTPQVVLLPGNLGSGFDFDLKTKRTSVGVGMTKWLSSALQFEMDVKTEKKEGARLFGIGATCVSAFAPCGGIGGSNTGWAALMLPEPVNASHVQVETRLSYALEKLRVNVGYYGSFYRNENGTLNPTIPGSLNNPVGSPFTLSPGLQAMLSQPVALAPDNQAHQLDVGGSYRFTGTTTGNFKLAYTKATQDNSFAGAGLIGAPAGRTSLDGEVVTTLAKFGVTSRPIPKLSLLADWRYENKDDNTPIAAYNTLGALTWTNRALPYKKTHGKLQAGWQFSSNYRGSIGADYEAIDRGVFTPSSAIFGTSALRQKTQETGINAELRRAMSENFSTALTLSSSRRDGSNWLRPNGLARGVTEVANPNDAATGFSPSSIFMPTLADRQRDKVKLFADWQPNKDLSLQFSAEAGKDSFTAPTSYGLQKTDMNQFSVDMGYELSSKWALNAFASRGVQTLNQSRFEGAAMAFDNTSLNAGIGFTGKPISKLEVGGNLSYASDKSVYAQTLDASARADSVALLTATGGLPNIVYRQTSLSLFGKYALSKRSAVRVNLVHQRASVNDWTWGNNGVPFTYSDGTTVAQNATQKVSFIGVTYIYQLP
jgi:MtrB/PioB family decaheme-associated outer membrane protein